MQLKNRKHPRATLRTINRVLESALWSGALLLSLSVAAHTQPTARAGFDFGGKKFSKRDNGVRLDGDAYIKSPQLDARANTIAFDFEGRQVTSVRAVGGVNLKINMVPRGGGAPARIETTSDNASLDPVNRVLILTGNVDGFYQLQGGARNTLKGSKATINYSVAKQFSANVEGGSGGVQLVIPAPETPAGTTQQIGAITVTGQNLNVDSAQSTAVVTGNAHAFSTGGATRFDFTGPNFTVTREAATGAMTNLRSSGRSLLKVNLPVAPVSTTTATPVAPTTSSTGNVVGTNNPGRPTYLEVAGDAVTINVARDASGAMQLSTLTFDGNVTGFYRLQTPDGKTTDNRFTGDHAVIQNVGSSASGASNAANFQIEVTGAPVNIQTPFELGF